MRELAFKIGLSDEIDEFDGYILDIADEADDIRTAKHLKKSLTDNKDEILKISDTNDFGGQNDKFGLVFYNYRKALLEENLLSNKSKLDEIILAVKLNEDARGEVAFLEAEIKRIDDEINKLSTDELNLKLAIKLAVIKKEMNDDARFKREEFEKKQKEVEEIVRKVNEGGFNTIINQDWLAIKAKKGGSLVEAIKEVDKIKDETGINKAIDGKTLSKEDIEEIFNNYAPTKTKHGALISHLREKGVEDGNKITDDKEEEVWKKFLTDNDATKVIKTIVAHEYEDALKGPFDENNAIVKEMRKSEAHYDEDDTKNKFDKDRYGNPKTCEDIDRKKAIQFLFDKKIKNIKQGSV
ncbi:1448_t:CDS:2 [Paraglomus occultum]|uniref:1448_t:CDS:1 n=1 Tax=Paraglomus occultum TaxID=144539 RepID=A0A9N8YXP0_9GLOM|nr:1448_t:CDS:2 [Paraglomus occultum]